MLHSDELKKYEGALSNPVKECLGQIRSFFTEDNLNILQYDDYHIAIPVTYQVSLPTRGAIGNIDIRETEPVLVVINLNRYPDVMPSIKSDRKDFPKKHLPHLYVSREDKPASFCLVRNSPDEWFANKRMHDLLTVGAQWLYKAANGLLVEDANEFDPTRLENYRGAHIYKYSFINKIVADNKRFDENLPYAVLLTSIENTEGPTSYESMLEVTASTLGTLMKLLVEKNKELEKASVKLLFTPVIWREDSQTEELYCTDLPTDYSSLKTYFNSRGIDIQPVIKSFLDRGLHLRNGLPLIHAIKRPKKMVGYDGVYELINFMIYAKEAGEGVIPDEAEVCFQRHIEPFSAEMAKELSGEVRDNSTLFVGGGSLGSKIIIHDARSGKMKIGVADHDELLDHNMARHALYKNNVGANKATAIVAEIASLYKIDDTSGYKAYSSNLIYLADKVFPEYEWMVDTTASMQVQNLIAKKQLPPLMNIARCELANDGKLGLLYIEGSGHNPRMDDLMALTYYKALENKSIRDWRITDSQKELKNLNVGLGCSSTTTVMPDDAISFHASVFSKLLHREKQRNTFGDNGFLFRSIFDMSQGMPVRTEAEIIKPFEIYHCQHQSGWEVRFISGLSEKILRLCQRNGTIETGGVLVGLTNYKSKTIHVLQIVVEPQGSSGTCAGFTRGNKGLPEYIDKIKEATGEVIGYVGEWHTHPMDRERLSAIDLATIEELKKINCKVPIPTCAIIVTNNKILPFVFE